MGNVRVLVVDDQAPFRLAASALVGMMSGFELVGAVDSGEEAVTAAVTLRPDLILMDVTLGGISGPEATRRITSYPGMADVRVLLVSTYDASDVADDISACGAAGFLSKASFDGDALREAWLGLEQ
ncbi:response regulator [Terrabacter sp. AAH1]|jgi:DNA-binding NarL/FixJ family response regulator